jgi:hypothetical protein
LVDCDLDATGAVDNSRDAILQRPCLRWRQAGGVDLLTELRFRCRLWLLPGVGCFAWLTVGRGEVVMGRRWRGRQHEDRDGGQRDP